MLTATEARTQNVSTTAVETEIFVLNLNILNNNLAGNTAAIVTRTTNTYVMSNTYIVGTPMTLANSYYNVWQGTTTDGHKTAEMNKVIDYYQRLGYTVNRKSSDGQSLYWQISW